MERQSESKLIGSNFYGNCFIRGWLSTGAGARTNVPGLPGALWNHLLLFAVLFLFGVSENSDAPRAFEAKK